MRLLFVMDKHDHDKCIRTYVRDSARSIIIHDDKVAMVHSLKYDYYKFPGGGIEEGEDPITAMIRETREESGLIVIENSIEEYGYVHRVQRSDNDPLERFIQDNYYYLCEVEEELSDQLLDDYEKEEGFRLEYVQAFMAIAKDLNVKDSPYDPAMFEREARVLELLIKEGYIR